MSFSDIFKSSFLEGFTSQDINIYTAASVMAITSVIAFYIFIIYRLVTRKTFYSKTFNISVAVIAVITSAVIITIVFTSRAEKSGKQGQFGSFMV